jgi:YcxB-like protein
MKVTYSIGLEDFRSLRPPFTRCAGHNVAFKAAMAVCVFFGLLGVWGMISDMGIAIGGSLVGLAVFFALGAYYFEKQSVRRSKEKYERNLANAFQQAHCSEQRTLEVDENNFTLSSGSGAIVRPWSELVQFSETPKLFLVGSRNEGQIIPKSAFQSEGEVTEFRTFILEKLNQGRSITSRPVEFNYKSADFRNASLLHLTSGGGWRTLLKNLGLFAAMTYAAFAIWHAISPRKEFVPLFGLLAAFLGVPLMRATKLIRKKFRGVLRIYFSDEGLHLQDDATQVRILWNQFIGYLEGKEAFLLYMNPRLYRIIPKRALGNQASEFREMVQRKLQRFDYKDPLRVASPSIPNGSGQPT